MAEYTGYCVKCRVKGREIADAKEITMKGKGGTTRRAVTGKCSKCGCTMYSMLKKVQ